jgi:steroid delta-isomerase-like uncharacterized protein
MTTSLQTPFLNTRQDEAFRFLGVPTLLRATAETTNGAFGLIESWEMPPEFSTPYHKHHREDESFYVLEGEMAFVVDGKWLKGGPGTFVYGPREISHGFKVIGNSPAKMLLMCNPGGFEGFVRAQQTPIDEPPSPPDMGRLMTLAGEYGIDILGPLPDEPEGFRNEGKPADHKSLTHSWIQAFNARDWKAESALRSAGFQARLSGVGSMDDAGWTGFITSFVSAFPDAKISIDSCIAEGDTAAARWTLTGTHQGMFQGVPPTGRTVTFSGIEFNHVENGKLVEHFCNFDNLALLQQIGAMPA